MTMTKLTENTEHENAGHEFAGDDKYRDRA